MINKKRAEGNAFGSFLRFRYYKISVDSALMLEYYFFTIDMFATKGLRLSLVLLLFITIVVLPTIFVVYLCPHDNLDEGWMWAHSFAYSDNGSRVHFTSNTFFT